MNVVSKVVGTTVLMLGATFLVTEACAAMATRMLRRAREGDVVEPLSGLRALVLSPPGVYPRKILCTFTDTDVDTIYLCWDEAKVFRCSLTMRFASIFYCAMMGPRLSRQDTVARIAAARPVFAFVDDGPEEEVDVAMIERTVWELKRPVRVIERSWIRHQACQVRRRKWAVRVIEDAVLHAAYRPGGWGYNAIQARWMKLRV